jgi:hypothetical protein
VSLLLPWRQRLANALKHEYGLAWAKVEKRGVAWSELVKQQIFVTALVPKGDAFRLSGQKAASPARQGCGDLSCGSTPARSQAMMPGLDIAMPRRFSTFTGLEIVVEDGRSRELHG